MIEPETHLANECRDEQCVGWCESCDCCHFPVTPPDWQREYAKLWAATVGAVERGAPTEGGPDDMGQWADRAGVVYDKVLRAERDSLAAALAAAEAQRDEWERLTLYAFHLAQYGENCEGGNETWRQFEHDLRMLTSRQRGGCMSCGETAELDEETRRCPSCAALAAPTSEGCLGDCGWTECRPPCPAAAPTPHPVDLGDDPDGDYDGYDGYIGPPLPPGQSGPGIRTAAGPEGSEQ